MSERRVRRSREQWHEIVAEFCAGSESERTFCERCGLTLATFRKWRYRFNSRPPEAAAEPAFIEVTRSAETSEGVVLHIAGGICVECPASMSVYTIAELVEALRGGR
jgi:hypothetical protein